MEKIFDIAKDSEQSWGTLATAIDGNFEGMTNSIDIIKKDISVIDNVVKTNELLNKAEIEEDVMYKAADGSRYESPLYWATGLIPVSPGETIYIEANLLKITAQWTGFKEDGKTWAGQGGSLSPDSGGKTAHFTTSSSTSAGLTYIRISFEESTLVSSTSVRKTEELIAYIEQDSVSGLNAEISGLNAEISGLNAEISGLNANLYHTKYKSISDIEFTNGIYIKTNGDGASNVNFRISEHIRVNVGDEIAYSLLGYNNVIAVIAAYKEDGTFLPSKSVYHDPSYESGAKIRFEGTYIVESEVSYIILGDWIEEAALDSVSIPYKLFKPDVNADDIVKMHNEIDALGVTNQWKGLRISAFGTSITDTGNSSTAVDPNGDPTGKYLPYLIEMGEFAELGPLPAKSSSVDKTKSLNYGIAGGCINGHILYYIRYYLNGSRAEMLGNQAELITIEGSVNDYALNIPLGSVGDTVPYTDSLLPDSAEDGTFAGACYCAFKEAQEYAPNAVVVFLTETTGKHYSENGNDYSQYRLNSLGLRQIDYINMAISVAKYVGIPVIECGSESMINASNPDYIVDWIHHTYLGGKQYAKVIWQHLKNIPCKMVLL